MDPVRLLSLPPRITRHSFSKRDTLLYAVGVGAGQDAAGPGDLRFVYEENLEALPTMAVVLAYPGFWLREPEYGIEWKRVLHAEQALELHAALPVEGTVRGELTIDRIIDKGAAKGALLYSTRRVFEESSGRLLATIGQVSLLRGNGGSGGSAGEAPRPHAIPPTPADARMSLTTRPEQALIYRLSGDFNPLHADPKVAHDAGLERPILHGLCTYGVTGRALLRLLCNDTPARMRRMGCRFTAPAYPGETLTVSIWRAGPGCASFQVHVAERAARVIDNGYVEFEEG